MYSCVVIFSFTQYNFLNGNFRIILKRATIILRPTQLQNNSYYVEKVFYIYFVNIFILNLFCCHHSRVLYYQIDDAPIVHVWKLAALLPSKQTEQKVVEGSTITRVSRTSRVSQFKLTMRRLCMFGIAPCCHPSKLSKKLLRINTKLHVYLELVEVLFQIDDAPIVHVWKLATLLPSEQTVQKVVEGKYQATRVRGVHDLPKSDGICFSRNGKPGHTFIIGKVLALRFQQHLRGVESGKMAPDVHHDPDTS